PFLAWCAREVADRRAARTGHVGLPLPELRRGARRRRPVLGRDQVLWLASRCRRERAPERGESPAAGGALVRRAYLWIDEGVPALRRGSRRRFLLHGHRAEPGRRTRRSDRGLQELRRSEDRTVGPHDHVWRF